MKESKDVFPLHGRFVAAASGEAHNVSAEILARDKFFDDLHVRGGWPPRLRRAKDPKPVYPARVRFSFSSEDRRQCVAVALRSAAVRSHLNGRWETLACHRVSRKSPDFEDGGRREKAEVYLFNYTSNKMLVVSVQGAEVTKIDFREPWQHPETPLEMTQAINLARAHPDLKDAVNGLDAHAILRVFLDAASPIYRHRCMDVMFTESVDPHVERPVLFRAIVDLNLQWVVRHGPPMCGENAAERKASATSKSKGKYVRQ